MQAGHIWTQAGFSKATRSPMGLPSMHYSTCMRGSERGMFDAKQILPPTVSRFIPQEGAGWVVGWRLGVCMRADPCILTPILTGARLLCTHHCILSAAALFPAFHLRRSLQCAIVHNAQCSRTNLYWTMCMVR